MKRLEAICDAIAMHNHYAEPESEAYSLRNPGMLLAEDASGRREFNCHRAGYAALLHRVTIYASSNPAAHLDKLLCARGITMRMKQMEAVDFMSRCVNTALTLETPLQWFIEINHG